MNTSANFQIFPSPYAFGPKRKDFKDLMLRDGKKIISEQFIQLQPDAKGKLKQGIIQGLFNVKITGIDLTNLKFKSCLKDIFKYLEKEYSLIQSIKMAIEKNIQEKYD